MMHNKVELHWRSVARISFNNKEIKNVTNAVNKLEKAYTIFL